MAGHAALTGKSRRGNGYRGECFGGVGFEGVYRCEFMMDERCVYRMLIGRESSCGIWKSRCLSSISARSRNSCEHQFVQPRYSNADTLALNSFKLASEAQNLIGKRAVLECLTVLIERVKEKVS